MSAALRRTGAVAKSVKVGGKVLRLWCLNPIWRERPAHVWAGHYETRRHATPAARAEATVSDAEVPF